MFYNIKTFSHKGSGRVNEDVYFAASKFMWVLDGATGLGDNLIKEAESDAKWYTAKIDAFLKNHIEEFEGSLVALMRECIRTVWADFLKKIEKEKICSENYPSASGGIVRLQGEQLEYIVFGDCPVILERKDGNVEEYVDHNLRNLDYWAVEKYLDMSERMGIPFREIQKREKQILIDNRKRMNTDAGYYNISFLPEAAEHAVYGILPRKDISAISLSTDGFAQYYTLFGLAQNVEEYMKKMRLLQLEDIWRELYTKQIEDYKMENYPRFKVSDDATAIFCECGE